MLSQCVLYEAQCAVSPVSAAQCVLYEAQCAIGVPVSAVSVSAV